MLRGYSLVVTIEKTEWQEQVGMNLKIQMNLAMKFV
jgi:hypothetical protein